MSFAATAWAESGLIGQYYNSTDLTKLIATRIDPVIDFDWGRGRPFKEITGWDTAYAGGYQFSIRWTGFISVPATGIYTFWLFSDDGARMWVGEKEIYDRWADRWGHGSNEDALPPMTLNAGEPYPIKIEYYQSHVNAAIKLAWLGPGIEKKIVPTECLATDVRGFGKPTLTQQPADAIAPPGQEATFTVTATGGGTLAYQWQKNGKDIPDATTPAYTFKVSPELKDAQFTCAVTNAFGTTQSGSARLLFRSKSSEPAKDVIAAWDKKLAARAREIASAGHHPRFQVKTLRATLSLVSVSEAGDLVVAPAEGGQMDLRWAQLDRDDIRNLAVALGTEDTPLDHALAAFYLLLDGQTQRANEHLSKAAALGESVRKEFGGGQ